MPKLIGHGFSKSFTPDPDAEGQELTEVSLEQMLERMQNTGFAPVTHIEDTKTEGE